MKLKPLGNRVVLQYQEVEEKTSSGIILPDSAKEKPQDAVKIYEEFRNVYQKGENPPKREYTKGHFKRGAE